MVFKPNVSSLDWIPAFLLALVLLALSLNHSLFWDSIQFGSLHPDFYFSNRWSSFWLPAHLDSGHPPFFGIYISFWWMLLGKNIWVTHLAMWPIALGILWQLWSLAKYLSSKYQGFILAILLLEPVLLGQITLVSPDLVLVFAFLLAINSILGNRRIFLILAILILAMISTRGMMIAAVLFLWSLYRERSLKLFWKKIADFLPGVLVGIVFLGAHYFEFGWIGYHEGSTWAPSFERVDFTGFLKNILIIGIHLLDFGHIFILFLLSLTVYKNWNAVRNNKKLMDFFALGILLLLFLLPTLLLHKNLFNHRYLLCFFLTLNISTILAVLQFWKNTKNGLLLSACFLIIGSFWIYPQPIATSWDGTILHWGYYQGRQEILETIEQEEINHEEIGTAFPNIYSPAIIDLKGSSSDFSPRDLSTQEWIFYSNVMNDFSADELALLETQFDMVKRSKHWPIKVSLYKRK